MAEDSTAARLVTLTDGVLAIAMTLLVLDVRLPGSAEKLADGQLWQALLDIRPQIFSYGLSFLVIAVLWLTHVQKFRHVQRTSALLIWLHIFFLLLVGFVPFTTALLAESGNSLSTAIYAVVMASASTLLGIMSVHARVGGLTDGKVTAPQLQAVTLAQFGTAAVFFVSAGVAFINADAGKYLWLLLVPLGFLRERYRETARQNPAGGG